MEPEHREVHFIGRVQGVGFRYKTKQIASRFAVTGWVKNLPNGQVQLVVEGKRPEIEAFLEAIQSAMSSNVDDRIIVSKDYAGQFDSFEIVR